MRIVIDARFYGVQAGIGRYIRNLINNLQKIDKENEYFILLLGKDFKDFNESYNFNKKLADFNWYGVEEQLRLPGILNGLKADLVHFPHFNIPLIYKGKFVVTIHDLTHQHFAMKRATTRLPFIYFIKQKGYKLVFKKAVRESLKIITPSNYVKNLIIKEYGINQSKINVIYEGVDDKILSIGKNIKRVKIEKIIKKFNITSPFIFYVGNAHPHKNVEGLITAFLEIKKNLKNLSLVLSGYDHYFWQRIKNEFNHKNIIFTNFVTDEELVVLYKKASCFVMPSYEEGFGLPVLEAMANLCPVVSSNSDALCEIGGNASVYFNPKDQADTVDKIKMVLTDNSLRKKMVELGQKRVQQFSWQKMAKQTLEVYAQCV